MELVTKAEIEKEGYRQLTLRLWRKGTTEWYVFCSNCKTLYPHHGKITGKRLYHTCPWCDRPTSYTEFRTLPKTNMESTITSRETK